MLSGLKLKISMALILILAFSWGYKKDELYALITGATNKPASVEQIAKPVSPVDRPEPIEDTVASKPTPAKTLPMRNVLKPVSKVKRAPNNSAPAKTYLPPSNPYANLSNQLKPPSKNSSFKEAFGSIKRNSISQKELMKKNAYFKKLSQDLKTLQGDKPEDNPTKDLDSDQSNDAEFAEDPAMQGLEDELLEVLPEDEALIEGSAGPDAVNSDETMLDELDEIIDDSLE